MQFLIKYLFFSTLIFFSCSCLAQLSMVRIAELPEKMYETSGLVFYDNKYILTQNDGGNKSELFVLDLTGKHIKTINIEGAENKDWEDLTQDDEGRVYIGDFGNNTNKRESCKIYILPKDFIEKNSIIPKVITFNYEDQKDFPPSEENLNFDCEAFFWKDDSLYLFSKCRTKPFTGITNVYVVPAKAGNYTAKKVGSVTLCSSNWQFCSVTSVDYNAKFKMIAILTYSRLYLVFGFSGNNFWEGKLKSYQLTLIRQREAICFKSKNSWYLTDEFKKGLGGGNLYEVKLKE